MASSAAFVVTLGLYLAAPSSTESLDEDIVPSHYRSLLVGHLTDVASPDQHTVKPWLLAWSDRGLRYWAISDAAAQDLVELRNLLDAQIRRETLSGSHD